MAVHVLHAIGACGANGIMYASVGMTGVTRPSTGRFLFTLEVPSVAEQDFITESSGSNGPNGFAQSYNILPRQNNTIDSRSVHGGIGVVNNPTYVTAYRVNDL